MVSGLISQFMINFKLIEKEDIKNYREFYNNPEAIKCDANLVSMYLWRNEYNIRTAVVGDSLVKAYFNDDNTLWGYCMPIGGNVKNAISAIFDDALERDIKPNIVMLTNAQRTALETMYPAKFIYTRSPENQDYIYLTDDLINLSGKKFHAKRNHITKFNRKYSNVRIELINRENKNDVLTVFEGWCAENNVDINNYGEKEVVYEALDNFEEFGMHGAVLYAEDKPVAMTLGTQISPIAFDIMLEKALREYDGVYAIINNEFAKTLSSYKYINREEDMGIEGLRKAKLSYNPVIILDRYNATLK